MPVSDRPPFMAAAHGTACCASPDLLYISPELSECLDCGSAIDWQHERIWHPDAYAACRECGWSYPLMHRSTGERCDECDAAPWRVQSIRDTGREHHPGTMAGAIRLYAWNATHDVPAARAAIRERVAQLPHEPACAFCGEPAADDTFREEGCPELPCCADEDACHERFAALDVEPRRIPGSPRHA